VFCVHKRVPPPRRRIPPAKHYREQEIHYQRIHACPVSAEGVGSKHRSEDGDKEKWYVPSVERGTENIIVLVEPFGPTTWECVRDKLHCAGKRSITTYRYRRAQTCDANEAAKPSIIVLVGNSYNLFSVGIPKRHRVVTYRHDTCSVTYDGYGDL
jgi:hypothetical protein